MSELFPDFINWMDSPEGKESVQKYITELKAKKDAVPKLGTPEFEKLYSKIFAELVRLHRIGISGISDTDLSYQAGEFQITKEEFHWFFDSLHEYSGLPWVEVDSEFTYRFLIFRELSLHLHIGQGSSEVIKLASEEERADYVAHYEI